MLVSRLSETQECLFYLTYHMIEEKKSEGYTYSMGQALLKDATMVAHGWLHEEIEPATFWLQALCH